MVNKHYGHESRAHTALGPRWCALCVGVGAFYALAYAPPCSSQVSGGALGQTHSVPGYNRPVPMTPAPAAVTAAWNLSRAAEDRARRLLACGLLVEAEAECRRAIDLPSIAVANSRQQNLDAVELLGEVLMGQGRYREAIECEGRYREALECQVALHTGAMERLSVMSVLALCRVGDYRRALEQYRYVRTRGGSRPMPKPDADMPGTGDLRSIEATALVGMGHYMGNAGSRSEAIAYFEAALRIRPNCGAANYYLAEALCQDGRAYDAIAYYRRAAETCRGDRAADAKVRATTAEAYYKYHPGAMEADQAATRKRQAEGAKRLDATRKALLEELTHPLDEAVPSTQLK